MQNEDLDDNARDASKGDKETFIVSRQPIYDSTFHVNSEVPTDTPVFRASPETIIFKNTERFSTYKKVLTLTNCDRAPRKIKFLSCSHDTLSVVCLQMFSRASIRGSEFSDSGYSRVASGLSVSYEVILRVQDAPGFQGYLLFRTDREVFKVPVTVLAIGATIVFDSELSLANVLVNKEGSTYLLIRNISNVETIIGIDFNDDRILSVRPETTIIQAKSSVQIEVSFIARRKGFFRIPFFLRQNLLEHQKIRLIGQAISSVVQFDKNEVCFGECFTGLELTKVFSIYNSSLQALCFQWQENSLPFSVFPSSGLIWAKCKISFILKFQPVICGLFRGEIRLSIDGQEDLLSIKCLGTANGPKVVIQPNQFNFGNLYIGERYQGKFVVKNTGLIDAQVSNTITNEDTYELKIFPSSALIGTYSEHSFSVSFLNFVPGRFCGTYPLQVKGCKPENYPEIYLKGNILCPSVKLMSDNKEIDFKYLGIGFTSCNSYSLMNTSRVSCPFRIMFNDELLVDQSSLSSGVFVASPCEGEIPPGQALDISVSFTPKIEANFVSILSIVVRNNPDILCVKCTGRGSFPRIILEGTKLVSGKSAQRKYKFDAGSIFHGTTRSFTWNFQNVSRVSGKVSLHSDSLYFLSFQDSTSIAPNQSVSIGFSLKGGPLGPNSLSCKVHNALNNVMFTVSVAFTVVGPTLCVPEQVYSDNIYCLQNNKVAIQLCNTSPISAEVIAFLCNTDISEFSLGWESHNIQPNSSETLKLDIFPRFIGNYEDTLCILETLTEKFHLVKIKILIIGTPVTLLNCLNAKRSSLNLGNVYYSQTSETCIEVQNYSNEPQTVRPQQKSRNISFVPNEFVLPACSQTTIRIRHMFSTPGSVSLSITLDMEGKQSKEQSKLTIRVAANCIQPSLMYDKKLLEFSKCIGNEASETGIKCCTVKIQNICGIIASYNCATPNDIFTMSPRILTLKPMEYAIQEISMKSDNIVGTGVKALYFEYHSNESACVSRIPAQLTVELPNIEIDDSLIDFKGVEFGCCKFKVLTVVNTSSCWAYLRMAWRHKMKNSSFTVSPKILLLPPDGVDRLTLAFRPIQCAKKSKNNMEQLQKLFISCSQGNVCSIKVKGVGGLPTWNFMPEAVAMPQIQLGKKQKSSIRILNTGCVDISVSLQGVTNNSIDFGTFGTNPMVISPSEVIKLNMNVRSGKVGDFVERAIFQIQGKEISYRHEVQISYACRSPCLLFKTDICLRRQQYLYLRKIYRGSFTRDDCYLQERKRETLFDTSDTERIRKTLHLGSVVRGNEFKTRMHDIRNVFLLNSFMIDYPTFYFYGGDVLVGEDKHINLVFLYHDLRMNDITFRYDKPSFDIGEYIECTLEPLTSKKGVCHIHYRCDRVSNIVRSLELVKKVWLCTSSMPICQLVLSLHIWKPLLELIPNEDKFSITVFQGNVQIFRCVLINRTNVLMKINLSTSCKSTVLLQKTNLVLQPGLPFAVSLIFFSPGVSKHKIILSIKFGQVILKKVTFTLDTISTRIVHSKLPYTTYHSCFQSVKTPPALASKVNVQRNVNEVLEGGEYLCGEFVDVVKELLQLPPERSYTASRNILFQYDNIGQSCTTYNISNEYKLSLPNSRLHGSVDICVIGENFLDSHIVASIIANKLSLPLISMQTLLTGLDDFSMETIEEILNQKWIQDKRYIHSAVVHLALDLNSLNLVKHTSSIAKAIGSCVSHFDFLLLKCQNFESKLLSSIKQEFSLHTKENSSLNELASYTGSKDYVLKMVSKGTIELQTQWNGSLTLYAEDIKHETLRHLCERYRTLSPCTNIMGYISKKDINNLNLLKTNSSVVSDGDLKTGTLNAGDSIIFNTENTCLINNTSFISYWFLNLTRCIHNVLTYEYPSVLPRITAHTSVLPNVELFEKNFLDIGKMEINRTIRIPVRLKNIGIADIKSIKLTCVSKGPVIIQVKPVNALDLHCNETHEVIVEISSPRPTIGGALFTAKFDDYVFQFCIQYDFQKMEVTLENDNLTFIEYVCNQNTKNVSIRLTSHSSIIMEWSAKLKNKLKIKDYSINPNESSGTIYPNRIETFNFNINARTEVKFSNCFVFTFKPWNQFQYFPKNVLKKEFNFSGCFLDTNLEFWVNSSLCGGRPSLILQDCLVSSKTKSKLKVLNKSNSTFIIAIRQGNDWKSFIQKFGQDSLLLDSYKFEVSEQSSKVIESIFRPLHSGNFSGTLLKFCVYPKPNNASVEDMGAPIFCPLLVADVSSKYTSLLARLDDTSSIISATVCINSNFTAVIEVTNTGLYDCGLCYCFQNQLKIKAYCYKDVMAMSDRERCPSSISIHQPKQKLKPSEKTEITLSYKSSTPEELCDKLLLFYENSNPIEKPIAFGVKIYCTSPRILTRDYPSIFPDTVLVDNSQITNHPQNNITFEVDNKIMEIRECFIGENINIKLYLINPSKFESLIEAKLSCKTKTKKHKQNMFLKCDDKIKVLGNNHTEVSIQYSPQEVGIHEYHLNFRLLNGNNSEELAFDIRGTCFNLDLKLSMYNETIKPKGTVLSQQNPLLPMSIFNTFFRPLQMVLHFSTPSEDGNRQLIPLISTIQEDIPTEIGSKQKVLMTILYTGDVEVKTTKVNLTIIFTFRDIIAQNHISIAIENQHDRFSTTNALVIPKVLTVFPQSHNSEEQLLKIQGRIFIRNTSTQNVELTLNSSNTEISFIKNSFEIPRYSVSSITISCSLNRETLTKNKMIEAIIFASIRKRKIDESTIKIIVDDTTSELDRIEFPEINFLQTRKIYKFPIALNSKTPNLVTTWSCNSPQIQFKPVVANITRKMNNAIFTLNSAVLNSFEVFLRDVKRKTILANKSIKAKGFAPIITVKLDKDCCRNVRIQNISPIAYRIFHIGCFSQSCISFRIFNSSSESHLIHTVMDIEGKHLTIFPNRHTIFLRSSQSTDLKIVICRNQIEDKKVVKLALNLHLHKKNISRRIHLNCIYSNTAIQVLPRRLSLDITTKKLAHEEIRILNMEEIPIGIKSVRTNIVSGHAEDICISHSQRTFSIPANTSHIYKLKIYCSRRGLWNLNIKFILEDKTSLTSNIQVKYSC